MGGHQTPEETRERILTAAAEEILAYGYAGSTLSGIAARLGLTKGALAFHFPTKVQIARSLMERFEEFLAEADNRAKEDFPDVPTRTCVALAVNVGVRVAQDPVCGAALGLYVDPAITKGLIEESANDWLNRMAAYLAQADGNRGVKLAMQPLTCAQYLLATLLGAWATSRLTGYFADVPRMLFTERVLVALGFPEEEAQGAIAAVLETLTDADGNVRVPAISRDN